MFRIFRTLGLALGLLGGAIATGLGGSILHLGALDLNHYTILMVASSIGRAAMALVFARRL